VIENRIINTTTYVFITELPPSSKASNRIFYYFSFNIKA